MNYKSELERYRLMRNQGIKPSRIAQLIPDYPEGAPTILSEDDIQMSSEHQMEGQSFEFSKRLEMIRLEEEMKEFKNPQKTTKTKKEKVNSIPILICKMQKIQKFRIEII